MSSADLRKGATEGRRWKIEHLAVLEGEGLAVEKEEGVDPRREWVGEGRRCKPERRECRVREPERGIAPLARMLPSLPLLMALCAYLARC
jgi:hypothetical protein